ncbi:unnamed protein product [Moneuplotes crassus]|uniref:Uncharacterized protein n=1 Tax=Euplotes crassus TaxID=5936 RepID=A0AAD2D371_EUPCR|nr:unnamed protein product [Moneuplotes crassus]
MESREEVDYIIKLILLGDCGAGKTSILERYNNPSLDYDLNDRVTTSFDLSRKVFEQDNMLFQLHVWDTIGQEKYKSLIKTYYKKAIAAIVVYDITSKSSFKNCKHWLDQLKKYGEYDFDREVQYEEGEAFAHQKDLQFYETSALEGENIKEMFDSLLNKVVDKLKCLQTSTSKNPSFSLVDTSRDAYRKSLRSHYSSTIMPNKKKRCKC